MLKSRKSFEHKFNSQIKEPDEDSTKRYPRTIKDTLKDEDKENKEKKRCEEKKEARKEMKKEELKNA